MHLIIAEFTPVMVAWFRSLGRSVLTSHHPDPSRLLIRHHAVVVDVEWVPGHVGPLVGVLVIPKSTKIIN